MSRLLGFLIVALASFAYGVAAAKFDLFPYEEIRGAYARVTGPENVDAAPEGASSGAATGEAGERDSAGRRPGLWHAMRLDAQRGIAPDAETLQDLGGLGYLDGYEPAPDAESVTVHRADAAWPGVNLVVSGHAPEAFLIDMDGRTLHRWRFEMVDAWPGFTDFLEGYDTFWRRAHVFPNGGLLAIYDGIGLIELDRHSRLVWANRNGAHHDLFVDEDGTIVTLTRRERAEHPRIPLDGPIQEDFIAVLTADGEDVREVSVLSAFLDSPYASVLANARREGDILHTNTVELMDGRFAGRHPMFKKGNALISVRNLNTIAVVDLKTEKVVWALGGMWKMQHQPTVLENGHLLVFDNLGNQGRSKVVEIDPLTQEIVWDYGGAPGERLTSWFLGSNQRLPNGNTLITESTMGRAIEVAPDGELVWEFVNPQRAGANRELIASLFEVVRIDRAAFTPEFAASWER